MGGYDPLAAPVADTYILTCCDYALWIAMAQACYRFVAVHEALGSYRKVPGGMVSNIRAVEEDNHRILDAALRMP